MRLIQIQATKENSSALAAYFTREGWEAVEVINPKSGHRVEFKTEYSGQLNEDEIREHLMEFAAEQERAKHIQPEHFSLPNDCIKTLKCAIKEYTEQTGILVDTVSFGPEGKNMTEVIVKPTQAVVLFELGRRYGSRLPMVHRYED